jgi:hypothetical protein
LAVWLDYCAPIFVAFVICWTITKARPPPKKNLFYSEADTSAYLSPRTPKVYLTCSLSRAVLNAKDLRRVLTSSARGTGNLNSTPT